MSVNCRRMNLTRSRSARSRMSVRKSVTEAFCHASAGRPERPAPVPGIALLPPTVTWGTSPEDVVTIEGMVPDPARLSDEGKRAKMARALEYMGLTPGTKIIDIPLDVIFIGSCTNGRIEDLRAAAKVVEGKKVSDRLAYAMIVPGSGLVKEQAEAEGLHKIFLEAGFEWREPGCSMCLGMNPDQLKPGQRCASTSNRNFEGRQGYRGRTHLVSPSMAAAAAIAGHFVDVRKAG